MIRARIPAAVLLALTLVYLPLTASPVTAVSAGSPPVARIVPRTVPIGGRATLLGAHFPTGKFFTMLLIVPNGSKPPVRALVPQLVQADSRGNIALHFRMPIVPHCGSGWMYLFAAKSPVRVRTPVTLTRCTVAPGQTVPPPPPNPKP